MELNKLSISILEELSGNARIKLPKLCSKFHLSRYRIINEIEILEDKLGLEYTVELNYKKLGFEIAHIIYLKFSKKPEYTELKEVMEKVDAIQLAMLASGNFGLILFVVTKTSIEYSQIEVALQLLFAEYGARIKSAEITLMRLGYIPLNDDTIRKSDINETYKSILLILNKDSRIKIRDISKKTKISEDLIRYYLINMEKEGLINKYTAIITKPLVRFAIAYFTTYSVREGIQNRVEKERRELFFKDEGNSAINEFQMMFSTAGAAQAFVLGTFKSKKYGIDSSIVAQGRVYHLDRPEVEYGRLSKTIKGVFPLRKIDVKAQYNVMNWTSV